MLRQNLRNLMKFIEVGTKILEKLDEHLLPVAGYTNSNSSCTSCKVENEDELLHYSTLQDTKPFAINNKDSIFGEIIGYSDIKKEFAKALDSSSPVSILLCGPPGCGKSDFLKQIGVHFEDESLLIDGSYGIRKKGPLTNLFQ